MKAFSFVFSLHNRILYNSDVRCSLLREVACSIVWLRVTKWSDNRILYCAIRKWQGILGYPSSKPGLLFEYVLDIIISPLNSKFDRFSPILVREKKNYVSPHVEPLTVCNCSPSVFASRFTCEVCSFFSSSSQDCKTTSTGAPKFPALKNRRDH